MNYRKKHLDNVTRPRQTVAKAQSSRDEKLDLISWLLDAQKAKAWGIVPPLDGDDGGTTGGGGDTGRD